VFALFVPTPGNIAQSLLWMAGLQLNGVAASVAESAAGAAVPSFFLWIAGVIYEKVRHREGLGFGDVKLIAMIGAFLGLQGAVAAWFLGSISGSVLGLGYIKLTGKDSATYELPFGTFLCAAALLVAVFEKQIMG
jgi:leader peptidase (prepilin peptidase)/N-methyltransferase